jgi:uncharacterized protein YPO0396
MNKIEPLTEFQETDTLSAQRAGMRLHRCEFFNWGTFHGRVWGLDLGGDNTLLTGDIGSGKSTLVDAITTMLVPAQKIIYNKAAGADAKERDLRSYVLGYYKSEKGDAGLSARPVALREHHNTYSVILGQFRNDGFEQQVTLAQVFTFKEVHGQPTRFYVVADTLLSITEHFTGFGPDINNLRKRLRAMSHVEVHDSFPPYGAAFRRRFGIENEQALDLFYQTVSMKSVGNLTEFVRHHMLEAFPVVPRIQALIAHFDDLNRAHEAVLRAKRQIERLTPLVADCDQHASLSTEIATLRSCREALRGFFAGLKAELLEARLEGLNAELERLATQIESLTDKEREQRSQRDDIKRAIAENGGDRIEALAKDIASKQSLKSDRKGKADQYGRIARQAGLLDAAEGETFLKNRHALTTESEAARIQSAELQNAITDETVLFRRAESQHSEISLEIKSLRKRRSNIPANMLTIREDLCRALRFNEANLPFAGELIEVRKEEQGWEGAAERVLHNYALSLLVPDDHYARVAEWVDRTHLRGRLVYYRIRGGRPVSVYDLHPHSLIRKLAIQPDSRFYTWLEADLSRRFNYACCETLEQFRREERALTRAGQIKAAGERHEKDDRYRIDDRTRYVLGWSNEAKIAALENQAHELERRMQASGDKIAELGRQRASLEERIGLLGQLSVFENFRDLDWKPVAIDIAALEKEKRELEEGSDVLRTLQGQLSAIDVAIGQTEGLLKQASGELTRREDHRKQAKGLLDDCRAEFSAVTDLTRSELYPRLEAMRAESERRLTVETCDSRERDMRDRIQRQIDNETGKIDRLRDKIINVMTAYNRDYPTETREMDVSIEAALEYRRMLAELETDGLPRFEARFKELLNENTIREIANFQSQLNQERQSIRERIEKINDSMQPINFNPGRFIILESDPNIDVEIRDFQQELRGCTEGTLTGTEDTEYSESKFLEVKRIIERFRGREGTTELDKRWTAKVTDVRNWFAFSASERWREDGREHEHYTDSGGKSGGQKEKLAYTILAASLAYQFGLEWGETRSRSFRFVLIDEAFGRGSDESTRYGLQLFQQLSLQLLIVTPLQKIHVIEPYVSAVGFVHNQDGRRSMLRNLTIEEYRAERMLRTE